MTIQSEEKQSQIATFLGVVVGAGLDIGLTPSEIARAFSRKNVLAVAEIVKKDGSQEAQAKKPRR